MKDTVAPPRSARIVAVLHRLDANANAAVIEQHAEAIHVAMLDVITSRRARGFDIGHNDDGAYARPISSTVGPARELRDLRLICLKAIAGKTTTPQQWTTKWAAMPERIKGTVWRPLLIETPEGRSIDRSTLAMGFSTDSFAMLAPKPEIVLPAIEAELAKTPQAKTRTRNVENAAADAAIKAAYSAITGYKGGRVIRYGRLAGRLVDLGRDVDAIFGVTLFAVKDSKRFR